MARSTRERLPDRLRPGLDIVSIGINPSLYTVEKGFNFARPGNRFWPTFNAAGIAPVPLEPGIAAVRSLLAKHGIGFTDLVARATARADELTEEDYRTGARTLKRKLLRFQPSIAWFQGISAFQKYLEHAEGIRRKMAPGLQPEHIGMTRVFVTPNPSGANPAANAKLLLPLYLELKALRDLLRSERTGMPAALTRQSGLKSLYLVIALSSASHISLVGARLAVMLYALHLEASPVTVGVLAALFSLFGAVSSVYVGRWIDRVGPGRPMMIGAFGVVAGAALSFVWRDLAALFVTASVIGTFYNAFFIANQRAIGQFGRPEDRVRNFSLSSLGYSAASFIGPLLAGVAIDTAGYAATFALLALIALLPALALLMNTVEMPAAESPHAARPGSRSGTMLELFRDRALRRVFGVSLLAQSTWSIVQFLVPLYGAQIGLSASTIGLLMGAFALATVVIRVFTPWLSRRFTSWQLMISSFVVAGMGFVGMPAVTGAAMIGVFIFWMGLGLGLSGPIAQALLYEAAPPSRIGEVLGLRVTMMNVSHTAVPLVFGALGTAVGVGPVFWVLGATLFAGSWMTRRQWRRRK